MSFYVYLCYLTSRLNSWTDFGKIWYGASWQLGHTSYLSDFVKEGFASEVRWGVCARDFQLFLMFRNYRKGRNSTLSYKCISIYGIVLGGKTSGERTAWLECALGVSLLMFGAMLERCCALLPEAPQSQHHTDALLLLPAIKVC